jgi:hypothetical protein
VPVPVFVFRNQLGVILQVKREVQAPHDDVHTAVRSLRVYLAKPRTTAKHRIGTIMAR